ncbi:uncharacterized protein MKK02DRAFT_45378 [Dioszegia hungarica]|uniref:Uncharacterized protein n=1 Tax=Dioszegia hungarica TaxID=4972 RepID=A0AA38LVM2_9TREE|nr:uncharacterized protein MKK02DRAFT_45378 [Dioszegia hungarica]KAI9636673.1 hypothetical protein MKK02DRAFT_45378 [Dioszegia hungarica]
MSNVNAPAAASTAPLGTTGGSSSTAPSFSPPKVDESHPVSAVADHAYPNVSENVGEQEAATGPGTGGRSSIQQSGEHSDKVPFKDQVGGYAKKIHGTVFGNKEEKELGEAKLHGQA